MIKVPRSWWVEPRKKNSQTGQKLADLGKANQRPRGKLPYFLTTQEGLWGPTT